MNILKAYTTGFRASIKLPRPVFLIYLINFILAIMVAMPLFNVMDEYMGNRLIANQLLKSFNATVFVDFIMEAGGIIQVFLSQIKWILIIYWVVSIFLAGGIIRTLNQSKFSMSSFFLGAGYNFFRYLGISLIMLILQIVVILIIYVPTLILLFSISDTVGSERTLYAIFLIAMFVHILIMLFLVMVSDYAKYYSALYDTGNIFKSVTGGFSYAFNNFIRTFVLYILLVILPFAIVIGYFKIETSISSHIALAVFLMFIVQQVFILLRIWFRIWIYSSTLKMFTDDFLKTDAIQQQLSLMYEWDKKAKSKKKEKILTEKEILEKQTEIIAEG